MRYFLWIDDKKQGPYEPEQIRGMLERGDVAPVVLTLLENGVDEWAATDLPSLIGQAKPPVPAVQTYFIDQNGETKGPFTLEQLREMCRQGVITADTQVAKEGDESWRLLSTLLLTPEQIPLPQSSPIPVALTKRDGVPTRNSTFRDLLAKYLNETVGINWSDPKKYHPAKLIGVTDEYFSIFVADHGFTIHYPYHQVTHIIEAQGGISTGIIFTNHFAILIETMQLVVYSGAVGVSVSI